MGLLSASLLAEYQRANPIRRRSLEIVRPDATKRYSNVGLCSTSLGYHEALVRSWGNPVRAWADRVNALQTPEWRIELIDKDKDWRNAAAKDRNNLRGSAATIRYGSPNVAVGSWLTRFLGVVDTWSEVDKLTVGVTLRANDFALYSPLQKVRISRFDFPNLPKESEGLYVSISPYGRHDSFGVGTIDGQCRPVYVDTVGFRYLVGLGRIKAILHAYADGIRLATSQWTLVYENINGRWYTLIDFISDRSSQEITLDFEGLTENADGTGAPISDPCDQIKHWLVNFVFNDWQSGDWFADTTAPINTTHWAATKAWLNGRIYTGYRGARYIEATENQVDAIDEFDAWCASMEIKSFFTMDGKIAIRPDDTDDPGYITYPWFRHQYDELTSGPLRPVDQQDNVVRRMIVEGAYGQALGQYQDRLEILSAETDIEASDSVSMLWGPALISGKRPTDIATCTGWWGPGAHRLLNDSEAVASWPDQGGGSFDYAQGTAANQPQLKHQQKNGLPAVKCDGSNDFMDGTDMDNLIGNAGTIVIAFYTSDVATTQTLITDTSNKVFLKIINTGVLRARNNDGGNQEIATPISVGWHVAIWWHSAGVLRVYLDDPLAFASVASGLTTALSTTRIGANNTGGEPFKDYIGEIATFSIGLTDADLSSVFAGFASRWLERGDQRAQARDVGCRKLFRVERPRVVVDVAVPLSWLDVELGDTIAASHPFLPHPTGQGAGIEKWRRRPMIVTEINEDTADDRLTLRLADRLAC